MSIFTLRKQVEQQRLVTLASKQQLEKNYANTKAKAKNQIASPAVMLGSFVAGLASGWALLPARSEQSETIPLSAMEIEGPNEEKVELTAETTRKPLLAGLSDELLMVVTSVIAAKLSEKLTESLKDV